VSGERHLVQACYRKAESFAADDTIGIEERNDWDTPDPGLEEGIWKSLNLERLDEHAGTLEEIVGGAVRQQAVKPQVTDAGGARADLFEQALRPRLGATDHARGARIEALCKREEQLRSLQRRTLLTHSSDTSRWGKGR
jgi:hypothetical protein